jgi:hypothetical protein
MIALSIGNFDGVHRGHQMLIERLKNSSLKTVVITFLNHSSSAMGLLEPLSLSAAALKIALLKERGVDEVIAIPFTHQLADEPFEDFLLTYPIAELILGENATIGKNRLGTPDRLKLLGLQRGFRVHTIPTVKSISSSLIRQLIAVGDLAQAEELLGRPYCFFSSSTHIALPPDGCYRAWSYSESGIEKIDLLIQNQVPILASNRPQLISFGPNLNPLIFKKLCQIFPVASSDCRTSANPLCLTP